MATGKVCVEAGSEETFEFICTWCKDTKIVEAEKYCGECDEHYCLVCADSHKRVPALKGHVLLGRDDVNIWGKQSKTLSIPTERCERHPGKLVELFCGQHKELCCHICVSLDHRICEGMMYIAEAAKGIDESVDFKAVINDLGEIKADLEKTTSKQQASVETSRCDILEQIAAFRNCTNKMFVDLEEKVSDEMDMLVRDSSRRHNAYQKACDDILLEIQQLQQLIESDRSTNEPQTFINMKKCQFQILRVNHAIEELPSHHADDQLMFEMDSKLEKFLANLHCIGTITVQKSTSRPVKTLKSDPDSGSSMTYSSNVQIRDISPQEQQEQGIQSTSNDSSSTKNETQHQEVRPLKVSRFEKYNIKLPSDKQRCSIGICLMFDDSILLSDFKNSNIKRLNASYQISDHLNIPPEPTQLCQINKQEVVVASSKNKLTFISIKNDAMKIIKSIELNHPCYGVACTSGRLFVSSDSDAIYILTKGGKFLSSIKLDSNKQSIFSRTRQLTSSPDGTQIFVADDQKGLVVLDKYGEVLSTYKDNESLEAESVFADVHGLVLVCYYNSKTIMQMNKEGTKSIREIVKLKSYEIPKSVCIDYSKKKMLVSINENNFIRVYDIDNL